MSSWQNPWQPWGDLKAAAWLLAVLWIAIGICYGTRRRRNIGNAIRNRLLEAFWLVAFVVVVLVSFARCRHWLTNDREQPYRPKPS